MPSVKKIVKKWLKQNGYNGLYSESESCGCEMADLMPCGSDGIENCKAGHKKIVTEEMKAADPEGILYGEVEAGDWIIGPGRK
jgi:hypothetical protein